MKNPVTSDQNGPYALFKEGETIRVEYRRSKHYNKKGTIQKIGKAKLTVLFDNGEKGFPRWEDCKRVDTTAVRTKQDVATKEEADEYMTTMVLQALEKLSIATAEAIATVPHVDHGTADVLIREHGLKVKELTTSILSEMSK